MQVFFILFSVYFAIYQYINSKCLYRTHVNIRKQHVAKVAEEAETSPPFRQKHHFRHTTYLRMGS